MRIYWSIYSFPELQGLPREEQRRLWKQASIRVFGKKLAISFGLVFGVAAVVLLINLLPDRFESLAILAAAFNMPFISLFVSQYAVQLCRPVIRELRELKYGEDWSKPEISIFDE